MLEGVVKGMVVGVFLLYCLWFGAYLAIEFALPVKP